MKNDHILFECIDCKETYLADNLCDGYNCPKCNGHIVPRGFIKEIEEGIEDMQDKIKMAKKNGLIRGYYKNFNAPKPNLPPKPEEPPINYKGGVDLSNKKDHTIKITTNNPYIDKGKLAEEIIEKLYNPRNPRRSGDIK